jgi:hypothetical protein
MAGNPYNCLIRERTALDLGHAKDNQRDKLYRWRIVRLKKTPAADVGRVEAPAAETAIREAIRKYDITDPAPQQRLAAYRVS